MRAGLSVAIDQHGFQDGGQGTILAEHPRIDVDHLEAGAGDIEFDGVIDAESPGILGDDVGVARLLPLLMAMMASRRDTVPSLGIRSSAAVVTVITAAWAAALARRAIRQRAENFGVCTEKILFL